ncbi:efflux transporter outer membrane subunit [Sphingomonas sp.]|uniref:efflux transporter outer membrane subunit n=1 Tax=Sphingomonas sp. TaxID=28214 RepID=UPI001D80166D|nr:efflux transporter outer membrane subunit [Sphingomonas sp.]MBX9797684.1 efflux transporter outer membrane subunit [Sphingomonas sp.]
MKRLAPVLLALLAGCSFVPKYQRPAPPVPATWPQGAAYAPAGEPLPSLSYPDVFRDPRLQTIITRALANNRDLRIAAANIAAARGQYRVARADRFPTLGSNNTGSVIDPGTGRTNNNGAPVIGGERTTFNLSFGATAFEIDLFGRVAALAQAARNQYFASEAGARATRLTLVGDIATAWLQYGADQSLLELARQTERTASDAIRLVRARVDGGVAPRSDLTQAETVLALARSNLAQQTTAVAQDVNALELLVGAPVEPALLPASIEQAGPTIADLPAGTQSTLLLRRPDIVQAEYQLRAVNAQVGAARAAMFPRISFTALGGLASNNFIEQLFTTRAFNYSLIPGINYPVFAGGRAKANLAIARAQFDAALATYERSIQTAFREVADALARRGTIEAQLGAQNDLTRAASETFRLTEARYRGGIDSYLANLDAQRALYQAQQTLVTTQLVAAANRVALYRALGGDALIDAAPTGPVPATPAAAIR